MACSGSWNKENLAEYVVLLVILTKNYILGAALELDFQQMW